jgi:hypothetical protein
MDTTTFATTAADLAGKFGNSAHVAIGLFREGGERLAQVADERWMAAFKASSPQLTAETRRNATRAKQVLGSYYARGLALSADSAEVVVDTLVGATVATIRRAAGYAQARAA